MQISELTDKEQKYLKAVTNEYLGKLHTQSKRNKKIANIRNQIETENDKGEIQ